MSIINRRIQISFFVLLFVIGCSSTRIQKTKRKTLPSPEPPKYIDILISIRDWKIVNNRILNYDPEWGRARYEGKFIYLDSLVIKISLSRFPHYFWIARLPERKEGEFKIKAVRYSDENALLSPKPPDRFVIKMIVENKTVKEHALVNSYPGRFVLVRYSREEHIGYFKNYMYPNCIWFARFPSEDGNWRIEAILLNKEECYGAEH